MGRGLLEADADSGIGPGTAPGQQSGRSHGGWKETTHGGSSWGQASAWRWESKGCISFLGQFCFINGTSGINFWDVLENSSLRVGGETEPKEKFQ